MTPLPPQITQRHTRPTPPPLERVYCMDGLTADINFGFRHKQNLTGHQQFYWHEILPNRWVVVVIITKFFQERPRTTAKGQVRIHRNLFYITAEVKGCVFTPGIA